MTAINPIWTIVLVQSLLLLGMLVGICANYLRVINMRADLIRHRLRLEQSLNRMEQELQDLRDDWCGSAPSNIDVPTPEEEIRDGEVTDPDG